MKVLISPASRQISEATRFRMWPVHLPAVQGGRHLLQTAVDVVIGEELVIYVGGGHEDGPAEVGDEAVAGHPAAHVLVVGNEDSFLGEAAGIPEILPAQRRHDGVFHGEIEAYGEGGSRFFFSFFFFPPPPPPLFFFFFFVYFFLQRTRISPLRG